jgi:hypothetical protein
MVTVRQNVELGHILKYSELLCCAEFAREPLTARLPGSFLKLNLTSV